MQINYNKLPSLVRETLQGFFHPLAMDIDDLSLLNVINVKLSQLFSAKRIKFEGNQGQSLINYYAINICPSGGGKDQSLNLLNKWVFKDFKNDFYKERETFLDQKETDIRMEACNRYKKNEAKINAYIEEKLGDIRTLHFEENPKTPEGFYSSCLGFLNYEQGSVFVRNSEFASTMKNPKPEKLTSYDAIMEASEGNLAVTTTKGDKKSKQIEGVPVNVIFVTDGAILVEDKKAKDLFLSYLQKGFARRSNICYQKFPEIKYQPDFEKAEADKQQAFRNARTIAGQLEIIYNKIPFNAVIKMDIEAKKTLHSYNELCKKQAEELQGNEKDIVLVDIRQRFWKAYKMAALIACINNPEKMVVTDQEANMAIYQIELFHQSFKDYIGTKPKADHEKVYYFLYQNQGSWVSKTALREQNFVHPNNFKKWWEEVYEHVESFAESKGFTLVSEKGKGIKVNYKLVKNNIGGELSEGTMPPEKMMEVM